MKKNKKEKKLSPISKKKMDEMRQYKEHTKHTQVLELGEHVSCKIRLQETLYADRPSEIGVDVRKWLNDKYPFKGGIQGILISKDKWLEFMQKATEFTISVFGKDVFYDGTQVPQIAQPIKQIQVVKSDPVIPKKRPIEETNWNDIIKKGKK